MNILECKNLTKTYGSGSNKVVALDGVNLALEKGSLQRLWAHPVPGSPRFYICLEVWIVPQKEISILRIQTSLRFL